MTPAPGRPPAVASQVEDIASGSAPGYAGLITRTLAFAVDAAVINGVAVVTAAVSALVLSVIDVSGKGNSVVGAIGGAVYLLWSIGYFVTFWATTGQTPGNRIMHIRVCATNGRQLPPRRALVRFAGMILGALAFFTGFLIILVDNRRRGFHDRLARTVVLDVVEATPDGAVRGRPGPVVRPPA